MRPEPVRQPLTGARLGKDEVRRAHRRHEQPRLPDLPAAGVDDADRVAGEVDEHLLAGHVALPHRRRQPAFPAVIGLAEPRVAEAVRMPTRYSCHSNARVTPRRRNSRSTSAHSGTGRLPAASAAGRETAAAPAPRRPVPAGKGHDSPAARARDR